MTASVIQGVNGATGVTFSATPSDGELIALLVTSNDTAGSIGTPSGFTPGPTVAQAGGKEAALFWKVAASESSSTYSIDVAPGNDRIYGWRISGADTTSPVGNHGLYNVVVSSAVSPAASSDVAMSAGSVALAITARGNNATTGTTVDNGFTLVSNQPRVCGAHKEIATAGNVNCEFTWSSANNARYSLLVEIRAPIPPTLGEADGAAVDISAPTATATGAALAEAAGATVEVSAPEASVEIGIIAESDGATVEVSAPGGTATGAALAEAIGAIVEVQRPGATAIGAGLAEADGAAVEVSAPAATVLLGVIAPAAGAAVEVSAPAATAFEIANPLPIPPRVPLPVVLVRTEVAEDTYAYYSDVRYVDAGVGLVADPRLGREITFERRVTTLFWGGGSSRAALGDIELTNTDGGLDALVFTDLRDHPVWVYLGRDDQPFEDFVLVGKSIVERVETTGESAVRIVLADLAARFARAVSQTVYTGGNQAGRTRPVTLGTPLSVPALATDIVNLRFATHYDAGAEVLTVYDRGVALTPTTQWITYETSPNFGFELQQSTAGRITANTQCDRINASYGYGALPNVVPALLAVGDALPGLGGGIGTDLEALQDELGEGFEIGYWIDGSVTFSAVLDDIADSFGGYWFVDLTGDLRMGRLSLPAGDPVLALTDVELAGEVTVRFDTAPGLSDVITGGRNWHVHTPDELADSVRDTEAGIAFTKDYRLRATFTLPAVYSRSQKAVGGSRETGGRSINGSRRTSSDIGTPTLIAGKFGLADEAARRAIDWAAGRYWYDCPAQIDATQAALLMPGDCIALSTLASGEDGRRYGLDATLLRTIGVRGVVGRQRVELTLWGAAPDAPDDKEKE